MTNVEIKKILEEFLSHYDEKKSDAIWAEQSDRFRKFWESRIILNNKVPLTDDEIDAIILILDKNAKGSVRDTQAVAKVMIPQFVWRTMFREFQTNRDLAAVVDKLFHANTDSDKIAYINKLYALNQGQKNRLTGNSGNGVNALLAAYDPKAYSFMVSLNARIKAIKSFGFRLPNGFEELTPGEKIIMTNNLILNGFKNMGLILSPHTLNIFCYYEPLRKLWDGVDDDLENEFDDDGGLTEDKFLLSLNRYSKKYIEAYFNALDEVIRGLKLYQNDERVVYSCPTNKNLVFITGQRISLVLSKKADKQMIGIISGDRISSKSDLFEGEPTAYWTNLTEPNEVNDKIDQIVTASLKEIERSEKSSYLKGNNPYFQKAVFDKEYRNKILNTPVVMNTTDSNLNQIFFGPPGTGKTYNTVNEAVKIVDPEFYNANTQNRSKLKERFRELLIKDWDNTKGQIAFCTFHQSFSYEDFVEGIKPMKPVEGDSYLKYIVEDGIFKRICRL